MNKHGIFLGAALLAALNTPAAADSVNKFSNDLSGFALQSTTLGSQALHGMADLTVSAVKAAGDSVIVILESADRTIKLSLKGSAGVARDLNLAAGQAVRASSSEAGTILTAKGRVLAFLPNAQGRKLIHASRYGG